MDVAKRIADEIEAIITPAEEERMNKIPTDDLIAYDYYLQGIDQFYQGTLEGLEEAISFFEKAIEHDPGFASAYADMAIVYSFLNEVFPEQNYTDHVNSYADQALFLDPELSPALAAKALYYINIEAYEQAVTYLEKAIEYTPNSALVINILSTMYANYLPDRKKYLEYALKGIELDLASHDSIESSFILLHISNAFMQSGFIDEADRYIHRSLEYDPDNLYAAIVEAFVLFARDGDLHKTKELLVEAFQKDTTRYDIIQEIGKICYYLKDYESAYMYFKRLIEIRETLHTDLYKFENAKIGLVFARLGKEEESEKLFEKYKEDAEKDESIYKHLSLAVYYSYHGNTESALDHFRLFSKQTTYSYLFIPFIKMDPLFDNMADLPEFREILDDMERQFWEYHQEMRVSLEKSLSDRI
jgi:tetratricopeptide (TPR) repeat protein